MARPERDIIKRRLLSLGSNERLFRINAGMGWVGNIVKFSSKMLVLANPRPLHGAPEGWPDLCGFTMVEITPDMVSQKIAVFTAEEVKASGGLSAAQRQYKNLIEKMGGIFRIIKIP
jgi:hypothetical protein